MSAEACAARPTRARCSDSKRRRTCTNPGFHGRTGNTPVALRTGAVASRNNLPGALRPGRRERESAPATPAARDGAVADAVPPFLAHVAHELRVPIGGVVGMTSLLLASGLSDRQRRYAKMVQNSAEHLQVLVDSVLDLARLDHGEFSLDAQPTDIDLWLAKTADPFVEIAALKGLHLRCVIDADLPRWLCLDGIRLRQVVSNLIANAIKHTRHGEVSLRLARSADALRPGLRCEVRDTGCGIASEEIGRLFHDFVQVGAPAARGGCGSGLGLAISRRLVERMGGCIGAKSQRDKGSVFWFELPAAAAPRPVAQAA